MSTTLINDEPKLIRTVGLWGLIAMCINSVVGSGVFLLPHESYVLLGPFSLWAPLLFAVPVFILVLCFAEAASHFEQPGGALLYARTGEGDQGEYVYCALSLWRQLKKLHPGAVRLMANLLTPAART